MNAFTFAKYVQNDTFFSMIVISNELRPQILGQRVSERSRLDYNENIANI